MFHLILSGLRAGIFGVMHAKIPRHFSQCGGIGGAQRAELRPKRLDIALKRLRRIARWIHRDKYHLYVLRIGSALILAQARPAWSGRHPGNGYSRTAEPPPFL